MIRVPFLFLCLSLQVYGQNYTAQSHTSVILRSYAFCVKNRAVVPPDGYLNERLRQAQVTGHHAEEMDLKDLRLKPLTLQTCQPTRDTNNQLRFRSACNWYVFLSYLPWIAMSLTLQYTLDTFNILRPFVGRKCFLYTWRFYDIQQAIIISHSKGFTT